MQKRFSLFLTLGLVACSAEVPTGSDYGEIVRTGYFESDVAPGDWRVEYISGEDARMDLSVMDFLLAHHYAYNDADELDEIAALGAISDALPDRIRGGDFAMQLQKALALSIDGHAPRISGMRIDGELVLSDG